MADFMKLTDKEILNLCCDNADKIQEILNELNTEYNVPEGILNELCERMFHHYYCDPHARCFRIGKPKIQKYEKYENFKEDRDKLLKLITKR